MSAVPRAITPNPHTIQIANKMGFQPKKEICVFIPFIIAKQLLCKHSTTAVTNTHATIELLDISSTCGPCNIKGA
jgi:hypothetical protein